MNTRWRNQPGVAQALDQLGGAATADAELGTRTTYRVGGPAAVGVAVTDTDGLARALQIACEAGLEVLVVGRGSNLLVADRGFEGVAIWMEGEFSQITWPEGNGLEGDRPKENGAVTAGAAVSLPVLARQCASHGLGGLEWAVGVPGSVGGAVAMNAGGHGSDIAACLVTADVLRWADGPAVRSSEPHGASETVFQSMPQVVSMTPADLRLGYRSSVLTASDVVLRAHLRTQPRPAVDAQAEIDEIVRWRRENQPGGQNAGSVFVNPTVSASNATEARSAGELIDAVGLKDLRVGGARVSDVHANFIVAERGATAADVDSLIRTVAERVHDATGIWLSPEVRRIGFDEPPAGGAWGAPANRRTAPPSA